MMRENGLPTPFERHQVSQTKLQEIFGAAAALYVMLESWGTGFGVLQSIDRGRGVRAARGAHERHYDLGGRGPRVGAFFGGTSFFRGIGGRLGARRESWGGCRCGTLPMANHDSILELLDEAPFVARLAQGLCRSGAEADDLVQDTWIEALRRPPAHLGSPRGFLATVVRRQWLRRSRGEARRSVRERASARAEVVGPAEADLERLELQARLLEAVRELPVSQARVVALHYYEQLDTGQIARRLGIPASTVRSRLARAVETLRERMDADTPGGRERWMAALAPVGGISMATKGALGASLTMKKWILGVGIVLLSVLGVKLATDGAVPGEQAPVGSVAMQSLALEDESGVPIEVPVAVAAEQRTAVAGREDLPAIAPSEAAELDVRAFWSDGEPAVGVRVVLGFRESEVSRQGGQVRVVEGDGVARFRGLPAGSSRVMSDRSRQVQFVELVVGERGELDFMLRAGETLRGRVLDAEGRAVAGAQIFGRPALESGSGGRQLSRADAGGEFTVRDLGETAVVFARAEGYMGSLEIELEELGRGVDGAMHAELEVWSGGVAFGGRVVDPAGRPVAEARVLLNEADGYGFEDGSGRGLRMAAPVEIVTDADGRFSLLGGVRPGSAVLGVQAPGWPALRRTVEVDRSADIDLELRLQAGASLVGHVVDASGAPLVGVQIKAGAPDRQEGFAPGPEELSAVTDGDGLYRIDGLSPGPCTLETRGPSAAAGSVRAEFTLEPGLQVRDLQIDPRPWIRGTVLASTGLPRVGISVQARGSSGDSWRARVDDAGAFLFASLQSETYTLKIIDGVRADLPLATRTDVRPSDAFVDFVLDDSQSDASISGRIDAATRDRFPGLELRVQHADTWYSESVPFDGNGGAFELDGLVAGTFHVWLEAGDLRLLSLPGQVLADGQRLDLGALAAPPSGRVTLRFDVERADSYHLRLVRADESYSDLEWHESEARSGELDPGTYRLEGFWEGRLVPEAEVRVEPGRETVMDLELPVGFEVRLVGQPGLAGEGLYEVRVLDSAGATVRSSSVKASEAGELEWSLTLGTGQYEWVVSRAGSQVSGLFEAGPESEQGPTVVRLGG